MISETLVTLFSVGPYVGIFVLTLLWLKYG